MRREEEMQGSASTCVRIRFQQHDVLPYAFCFNFLEATGSISFASPSALFFFAFALSCVRRHGFRRYCSPLVGTLRNVPRWFSALWMLLGIYLIPSFSISLHFPLICFSPPTLVPLLHPVSRFPFPPIPFIPSSRRALSHVTPPP